MCICNHIQNVSQRKTKSKRKISNIRLSAYDCVVDQLLTRSLTINQWLVESSFTVMVYSNERGKKSTIKECWFQQVNINFNKNLHVRVLYEIHISLKFHGWWNLPHLLRNKRKFVVNALRLTRWNNIQCTRFIIHIMEC